MKTGEQILNEYNAQPLKNKKSQIGETKMLTTDELARWTRLVEDCKSGKLRSINVGGQGIRAIIVKVDIAIQKIVQDEEPAEWDGKDE